MGDGTQSQVSDPDGSGADHPAGHTHPNLDPGRVARIVTALRAAHAEQAAHTGQPASAATTDTAELPDPPAPRRAPTGVQPVKPPVPTLRWDPGSRYRASLLANVPAPPPPAHAPVPAPPDAAPVPPPGPVPGPPPLAGRLFRGPARRTAVFEREIWHPSARSSRVPRDVGEALVAAVERYRKGSLSTSGLVRAIGRAHAA